MNFRSTIKYLPSKKVGQRLIFYFIFCGLIPVAFFLIIEICLVASNYGYPTGFFVREKIGEKEYYVNNNKFSWRFFPKSIARLPASVVVPVEKEKGALRIFVFGESAAMGDPDPSFSFSRMLKVLLEKKYPDKKIEIYNTAVTAINSHVLLPIVDDCLKLEPDLFIIYAGNNEVIGPFGLSAALSPFYSNRSMVKAKVWLGGTRLGQWLANITIADEVDHQAWRGMEMFMKNKIQYDNPYLETIYDNFQTNLTEICGKAGASGIPIILSTVITNTRDCAPFLSLHDLDLETSLLEQWEPHFRKGISLEDSGHAEQAIEYYLKANMLDDEYAELSFRLGKCYLETRQPEKAQEAFIKAQDLDALRFRADSRTNEIIKNVAYTLSDRGVYLADAKSFASQQSDKGITGNDLLYEHVHLNLKGNFVLANCILQQVENSLKLPPSMEVVNLEACKLRLAYSLFDAKRIDEINLSRLKTPPFTAQHSNKYEVEALGKKIENIRERFDTAFQTKTKNAYQKAVENDPSDWFLRLNYLRFLYSFNYYSDAGQEAEALYSLLPFEYLSSINMGITRQALKGYQESERYFQRAIEINPYFSEAYKNMAALLEEQGEFYRTDSYLRKSGASKEILAAFYNRAGIHFIGNNNTDSAVIYFTKAVEEHPNFPEAQQNLRQSIKRNSQSAAAPSALKFSEEYNKANAFFRQGNFKDAINYYQKALRITPSFPEAHNNIGICLIQLNQLAEARQHFADALKSDPDFYDAYPNLATVLYQLGQYDEAIKILEKALQIKQDPEVYHLIAEAYFQLGDKVSAAKYRDQAQKASKGYSRN